MKADWTHIYVVRAIAAQYWIEGNHDKAVEQFKLAMASAEKLGVPEVIVSVAEIHPPRQVFSRFYRHGIRVAQLFNRRIASTGDTLDARKASDNTAP